MIKLKDILKEIFNEGSADIPLNRMTTVVVKTEFSKLATSVIKTAIELGFTGIDDLYDHRSIWNIPFLKAFTKEELKKEIERFNEQHGLTYSNIIKGEFIELDSTNMSHAGAYYEVSISVKRDEALAAGLI